MPRKNKDKTKVPVLRYLAPLDFVTYVEPTPAFRDLKQDQPSCFNGILRIQKYRVRVELVEEPIAVLQQRLQDIWDRTGEQINAC